ncbi:hypothetical protein BGW38_002346 [Lunasporangiospora selenospora]|uniref:Tyrosine specific protein phosphatases domain-containing protein n=1 Tax=Lunasporangiospora selenospora TaxID=979761 RepID=A0A9P6FS73_9FUNG|nr:hypothetical protein BGW38_002346 [Lunasporangiospora selenospora]
MSSMSNESAKSNEDASQPPKPRDFQHKVILLAPGAQTRISDAILKEAIEFLKTEVGKGKKVLVHCRDGNGRSGSVAIAYIAAQLKAADQANNQRTLRSEDGSYYDRAEKEVWKWKCDVYPHRGLRESVERIQL